MLNQSRLAEIGALIGDPGRANMLDALMDGRALTARELAGVAGIAPQTASGHLSKLIEAGLIAMQQHGRHRYHHLSGALGGVNLPLFRIGLGQKRIEGTRAVAITQKGRPGFQQTFGFRLEQQ